jgi:hypothetical protein
MGSFKNKGHGCDASVEAHGWSLPLMCIGFFHIIFFGVPLPSFGLYPKMHEIEQKSKAFIGLSLKFNPINYNQRGYVIIVIYMWLTPWI